MASHYFCQLFDVDVMITEPLDGDGMVTFSARNVTYKGEKYVQAIVTWSALDWNGDIHLWKPQEEVKDDDVSAFPPDHMVGFNMYPGLDDDESDSESEDQEHEAEDQEEEEEEARPLEEVKEENPRKNKRARTSK